MALTRVICTGLICIGLFGIVLCGSVEGGLSSENVVVVVNGDSPVSRTIANHYIEYRQIPTKNVIVLSDVPKGIRVDLDSFRDKILKPLLAEVDARGIANSARVIAYSAGFPTAVNIPDHCDKITDPTTKKFQKPTASITGLTYFYRFVMSDNPGYLGFGSNLYARGVFNRHFISPLGGELKTEFENAAKLQKEGKFAESAAIWQKLHDAHPNMPGIALLAAETYSEADQGAKAVEMIRLALKAGWWSASYLTDTPALEKRLDDPGLQKALPLLDDSPIAWQGPEAFSSSVGWTLSGSRVALNQGGVRYLCSCSLAVVGRNASTLSGAVRILKRASQSDRKFPRGRFAFGAGSGVRSQTRFPGVANAIVYLQENGFETEIFRNVLPKKEGAILGMMVGTSDADPLSEKWIMVRGAIAENLTSFGGAFDVDAQVKLTDFLSAGAAMSSGAVAEPYSLQVKFPSPMLYAFYARGLSAIESFYQSVSSPYQLLIVGDPLAQPFAKAPDELVDITLVKGDQRKLRLARRPLGLKVPKSPTATIEVSIDDRLFKVTRPVPTIDINWPEKTSGIYDIRVTLTGLDRTQPRVTFLSEIDVDGDHPAPTAKLTKPREDVEGFGNDGTGATALEVMLECPGADRIELMHWGKTVAKVDSESGAVKVETKTLGGGPLRMRPVAYFGDTKVRGATFVDQVGLSK